MWGFPSDMKALISFGMAFALVVAGCSSKDESSDDTGTTGDGTAATGTDDGTGTEGGDADTTDGDDTTDTGGDDTTTDTGVDIFVPPPDQGTGTDGDDVVEPTETAENCAQALLCMANCPNNDKDCYAACTAEAEESIQTRAEAVLDCFENDCPGTVLIGCIADSCYETSHACWFEGESAEGDDALDCKQLDSCVDNAKDGAKESECYKSALAQAQEDYTIYTLCVIDFCKDPDAVAEGEDCVKKAEETECGTEYGHCFDF